MTYHQKTQKNQMMKYEEVINGTTYALTYAPSDRFQYWNNHTDRWKAFEIGIRTYMLSILGTTRIKYRIELSPSGRLHLHGYITVLDKMEFYLYTISKLEEHGTIVIKEIKDDVVWQEYCEKQNTSSDYHYVPPVFKSLKAAGKRQKRNSLKEEEERTESVPIGSEKSPTDTVVCHDLIQR